MVGIKFLWHMNIVIGLCNSAVDKLSLATGQYKGTHILWVCSNYDLCLLE